MKVVIVEIKNGFAAVLSDDGIITKVKNKNYEIGQVITMKQQKVHITKKLAITAASAAALFLASSIGVWAYTSPYSYVSLDVNPSIEYTVNRFDLVIDVKAVNDDGEELLGQINLNNLNNKTIHDAIAATINEIADNGYFDGTAYGPVTEVTDNENTVDGDNSSVKNPDITGGIIITASSKDDKKSEKLVHKLEGTAKDTVEETGDEVEIEVVGVGYDRVQRAKELGVTPGKLNLVEKLQASAENPESIVIEEWLNKPVKDIMKAIKDNRKGQSADGTEDAVSKTGETSEQSTAIKESKVQKAEIKEEKDKQKAADKAQKADAKAQKAEQKAADKAQKAVEKNQKAEQKAADKAQKANAKNQKAVQKAADNAQKAVEKNQKDKQKAADNAQNAVEKNQKAVQKAADNAQKADAKAQKAEQKSNQKAIDNAQKADEKNQKVEQKDVHKVKNQK